MINMGKAITVIIDEDLQKKLRDVQARLIQKHNRSFSFSKVLNMALKEGIKKLKA